MKTMTIRVLAMLALLFTSLGTRTASAASGSIGGTVTIIKTQDTAAGNTYFQVNSTVHVGQCVFDGTNRTLVLIPDNDRGKQMFAVVQAAMLAGKNVSVFLDDGNSPSAVYCFAKNVVITP